MKYFTLFAILFALLALASAWQQWQVEDGDFEAAEMLSNNKRHIGNGCNLRECERACREKFLPDGRCEKHLCVCKIVL